MAEAKTKKEFKIDATNRSIGRVATQAAMSLRGKNDPSFRPNVAPDVKVTVVNASKLHITKKKRKNKKYTEFSGYPGGLRFESLEKVLEEKGYEEVVKRAVYGMLPANRLRSVMIKNLIIEE